MEYAVSLIGWQLFFGLNLCREKKDIKLPTLDELKQMKKEANRRFRQAVKNKTHYNGNLRGFSEKP